MGLAPVDHGPGSLVALIVMPVLQDYGAVILLALPGHCRRSVSA